MRYAHDPHHLVLYELQVAQPAPVFARLLAPYPDATPQRLTHYGVESLDLLRWYRDSHLAAGVVLTGTLGEERLTYDPLRCVDLDAPRAVQVSLTFDAALVPIGAPDTPDLATVHAWLSDPNPLLRIAAIRRLGLDRSLPEALAVQAHALALVNEHSGVRQLASVHLSGFSPRLCADPARLLAIHADPLSVWADLGLPPPSDPGWSPTRARRDARYAVAWIFANLVRARQGPDDWRHAALAALAPVLAQPPREELVTALVRDEPEAHLAFGTPEEVGLQEWVAFVLRRERALEELGIADPFPWLARDARLLQGGVPPDNGGGR